MPDRVAESLLRVAAEGEQDRLLRIQKAWKYFHGDHPKVLAPVKRKGLPEIDDNIFVNFAKLFVLKGVSFLFGREFQWEITTDEEQKEGVKSPQEEFLDEVWGEEKMVRLKKYAVNGGVTGHPFFKITKDPRIIVLDPATVTPEWAEDDHEKVDRYRIQWIVQRGRMMKVRRQIIERTSPASWVIVDQESVGDSKSFVEIGREEWPFPFGPIVHNQNLPAPNEFWGTADLEADILTLNRGLNAVVSNINKLVRLFAHPVPVVEGVDEGTTIKADPGNIIKLPGGGEHQRMYVLDLKADIASSLSFLERLMQFLHETGRVPEIASGRLENVGNLSGLALQILYGPLLEMTTDKRGTYGGALVDLNKRLLVVGGKAQTVDEVRMTLNWPDPIPTDAEAEARTALLHDQLGISRDTIHDRLGFDPETEKTKREEEQGAMGEQMLRTFDQDG